MSTMLINLVQEQKQKHLYIFKMKFLFDENSKMAGDFFWEMQTMLSIELTDQLCLVMCRVFGQGVQDSYLTVTEVEQY